MKENQIAEYDINEAHIAKVTDKYKDFVLVPEDAKSKVVLMEGLKEHREIRLAIEKKRFKQLAVASVKNTLATQVSQVAAKAVVDLDSYIDRGVESWVLEQSSKK